MGAFTLLLPQRQSGSSDAWPCACVVIRGDTVKMCGVRAMATRFHFGLLLHWDAMRCERIEALCVAVEDLYAREKFKSIAFFFKGSGITSDTIDRARYRMHQ